MTSYSTEETRTDVKFIATLSDGQTAVEHTGEWQIKPGERKPWVRLCEYCQENNLHITSLRLNFNGRTIHLPRMRFDKFGMGETAKAPNQFSVQYHLEVDDLWGDQKGTEFISLTAHYDNFAVHYIQDVTDGANSWVVITEGHNELALSPKSP